MYKFHEKIVLCRVVQAGFMDHIYDYRGCVYRLKKKCTTYYMVWTYWSPLLPWLTQVCSFEGMDCEMDCDVVARCSFEGFVRLKGRRMDCENLLLVLHNNIRYYVSVKL